MAQIDVEMGVYHDEQNRYGFTIDDVALVLVGGWADCGAIDPLTLTITVQATGVSRTVTIGDQTGSRRKNLPQNQRPAITWDAARQRVGGIEIQAV